MADREAHMHVSARRTTTCGHTCTCMHTIASTRAIASRGARALMRVSRRQPTRVVFARNGAAVDVEVTTDSEVALRACGWLEAVLGIAGCTAGSGFYPSLR
jgi:hypothetical protein